MAGRTIAIGDIHGCRGKLSKILTHLQLNAQDKVIFLGDYIDRGPDSAGVISDLIRFSQTVSCVFLRGNHEDMLLICIDLSIFISKLVYSFCITSIWDRARVAFNDGRSL